MLESTTSENTFSWVWSCAMEVIWMVLTGNHPPTIESEFIGTLHREEATWFVQTEELLPTGTWGRGGGTWWGLIYLNLHSQSKRLWACKSIPRSRGGWSTRPCWRESNHLYLKPWHAEKYSEIRKVGLWRNLDRTAILTLYWDVDWGSNCF